MVSPPLEIRVGHVLDVLQTLPAQSIPCAIMSPPYWQLERFDIPDVTWPDGWEGQLGLEEFPQDYVLHLGYVFWALRRVMMLNGGIWWNMGDSALYKNAMRHDLRARLIPQWLANALSAQAWSVVGAPFTKRDGLYRASMVPRNVGGWRTPQTAEGAIRRAILLDAPNPDDLVLDPFCGRGFTGFVARQMGRPFLGIEVGMATALEARNRILGVSASPTPLDPLDEPLTTSATPSRESNPPAE